MHFLKHIILDIFIVRFILIAIGLLVIQAFNIESEDLKCRKPTSETPPLPATQPQHLKSPMALPLISQTMFMPAKNGTIRPNL